MSDYFDELETRDPEVRESETFSDFPAFLNDISSRITGWKERLSGVDIDAVTSRDALANIPVLRKPELMDAQAALPPFGGFVDESLLDGNRIFMSPGPVWEPQAPGIDPWLAARGFHAAGIRAGDLVHNAISYHMTPGGYILDEGARALGARVYPGGVGNTEMQVEAAAILKPVAYAGTPDFLQVMLDKANEMGKDLSSIKKALVSGGALFPAMRQAYNEQGITVLQAFATADVGVIAFETMKDGALCDGMICNEGMIVEIVRPGTDDPVPHGEVGEIVVTTFNQAYPLVRFGTGDMSAVINEASPCGRTNMRIKGWMGRADQRTKVKGMFVDPKQINAIAKEFPSVEKARLVVSRDDGKDVMTLQVAGTVREEETDTISERLTAITKLKGGVAIVEAIPNDGKIIDDQRDYSA